MPKTGNEEKSNFEKKKEFKLVFFFFHLFSYINLFIENFNEITDKCFK